MHAVFLDRDSPDQGDLDLSSLARVLPDRTFHDATSPDAIIGPALSAEVRVVSKVVRARQPQNRVA